MLNQTEDAEKSWQILNVILPSPLRALRDPRKNFSFGFSIHLESLRPRVTGVTIYLDKVKEILHLR